MRRFGLLAHLLILLVGSARVFAIPVHADIVIYGGTAGGLGWTDAGNKAVIGGRRQFYGGP